MQLANDQLLAQVLSLAAAPPALPLEAAAVGTAIAASLTSTPDHSSCLEKFPTWSSKETGADSLPPEDYLTNLASMFWTKWTPTLSASLSQCIPRTGPLATLQGTLGTGVLLPGRNTWHWQEDQDFISTLISGVVVELQRIKQLYHAA